MTIQYLDNAGFSTTSSRHARAVDPMARLFGSESNRHLLMFEIALVNLVAVAILAGCYMQGWIQPVFANDGTGLTYAIAAAFLIGLGLAITKAWRIGHEINCVDGDIDRRTPAYRASWCAAYFAAVDGRSAASRANTAGAFRLRITSYIASIKFIAGSLILMGLIGTVIGFIIALAGVSAESAGDLSAVSAMVTQLIDGMSIALFTTLEGAVLNLWLGANHHLLNKKAAGLVERLVLNGEADERV